MDALGVGLHSFQRIEDRWQLLVLHVDKGQRVLSGFGRFGGDGRHPIAHEAHYVPAEYGHVADHLAHEVAWDVLAGDDGPYAWRLAGSGAVNATDASVRIRAAEDFTPEQAWEVDIGGVNAATHDLVRAFRPRHGSADYR